MLLAHVQSVVSQFLLFASGLREPLVNSLSTNAQAPETVSTRHRPPCSEEHIIRYLEIGRHPPRSEERLGRLPIVEPRSLELRRAMGG